MKKVTLGLMTGIGLMAAAASPAQAAFFDLSIQNGLSSGGGTMTGTFTYDSISKTYSNFNITVDPDALSKAPNPFTYSPSSSNSVTAPFSPPEQNFRASASSATSGVLESDEFRNLLLRFDAALDSLAIGDETNLVVNLTPGSAAFGSNDTFIENGVEQTASVTGGLVRVENIRPVPEPLTILGAGTAIGFGTAFKKKLGKNKKNN